MEEKLHRNIKYTKDNYKLALIGAIHHVVRKAGKWITNEDQVIRFKKENGFTNKKALRLSVFARK